MRLLKVCIKIKLDVFLVKFFEIHRIFRLTVSVLFGGDIES